MTRIAEVASAQRIYDKETYSNIPDTGGEPTITDKLKDLLELQSAIDNMVAIIETKVRGPYPEQEKDKPDIRGYVDVLSILGEGYEAIAKRLDYLTRIM